MTCHVYCNYLKMFSKWPQYYCTLVIGRPCLSPYDSQALQQNGSSGSFIYAFRSSVPAVCRPGLSFHGWLSRQRWRWDSGPVLCKGRVCEHSAAGCHALLSPVSKSTQSRASCTRCNNMELMRAQLGAMIYTKFHTNDITCKGMHCMRSMWLCITCIPCYVSCIRSPNYIICLMWYHT